MNHQASKPINIEVDKNQILSINEKRYSVEKRRVEENIENVPIKNVIEHITDEQFQKYVRVFMKIEKNRIKGLDIGNRICKLPKFDEQKESPFYYRDQSKFVNSKNDEIFSKKFKEEDLKTALLLFNDDYDTSLNTLFWDLEVIGGEHFLTITIRDHS